MKDNDLQIDYNGQRYSPECVLKENYDSFIKAVAKSIAGGTLPEGELGLLTTKNDNQSGTWIPEEPVTVEHPHYREEVYGDYQEIKPEYELSIEQFASAVAWAAAGKLHGYFRAVNKSVYGRERQTFGGAGRGFKNVGSPRMANDASEAAYVKKDLHEKWSGDSAVWTAYNKGGAQPSNFFAHGKS